MVLKGNHQDTNHLEESRIVRNTNVFVSVFVCVDVGLLFVY